MTFSYWIQNSDYSNPTGLSESELVTSAAQVIEVFNGYDWAKENAYQARCEEGGSDCCPAGMGIVKTAGVILHICPNVESKTAVMHMHYPVPTKLLGFIKTQKASLTTFSDVPWPMIADVISKFLEDDYDAISETLERYAA